ncbi:MAG: HAD family hydrolase [Clostridia bacterium]|nr:HAD family hydrolase [Clostridia bacterium]
MTKLCIFDLDGTLMNTIPAISHFGNQALKKFGFPEITPDRYKLLVGNGRDLLIHRMLQEFDADTDENFENVGKAYDSAYEADPLYKTAPYDGILDMLDTLKAKGLTLAVLSNKPDNVTQDVVRLFFGDRFDVIAGQKPGVKVKPDPAGVFLILEELGIKAEESFFIGDTYVDISTGKNAGIESIGVLWGFRDEAELKGAGADHIVAKASEILDIILK